MKETTVHAINALSATNALYTAALQEMGYQLEELHGLHQRATEALGASATEAKKLSGALAEKQIECYEAKRALDLLEQTRRLYLTLAASVERHLDQDHSVDAHPGRSLADCLDDATARQGKATP